MVLSEAAALHSGGRGGGGGDAGRSRFYGLLVKGVSPNHLGKGVFIVASKRKANAKVGQVDVQIGTLRFLIHVLRFPQTCKQTQLVIRSDVSFTTCFHSAEWWIVVITGKIQTAEKDNLTGCWLITELPALHLLRLKHDGHIQCDAMEL